VRKGSPQSRQHKKGVARNPLLVRFGRGITLVRSQRQLTRKGLANRLKISYVQLGFWERGVSQPPIPKLFALTRILGTSLDELIEVGGSAEPISPDGTPDGA
jgi:transcriptional regulator with XRE-family HTH domain